MPFVKLDCGILNSTLWVEPIERDIFITALLMAVPFEFKTPQAQIAVNEIRETGFVSPPGWYGKVEAAGPGIVRRALIEQGPGMLALARLGDPDPGSRSQAWEGRRLIRIDGGYLVLNYMEYLLKDYSAAERMRRLRAKRRDAVKVTDANVTTVPVTDSDVTRTMTYIYTDANADAEKNKNKTMGCKSSPSADSQQLQAFARLKDLYPKRDGSQRWADGLKHYRARLREGYTHQQIEDGIVRYARFCHSRGLIGTERVQQAATFLGTNKGFTEEWNHKKPVLVSSHDPLMGENLT